MAGMSSLREGIPFANLLPVDTYELSALQLRSRVAVCLEDYVLFLSN